MVGCHCEQGSLGAMGACVMRLYLREARCERGPSVKGCEFVFKIDSPDCTWLHSHFSSSDSLRDGESARVYDLYRAAIELSRLHLGEGKREWAVDESLGALRQSRVILRGS